MVRVGDIVIEIDGNAYARAAEQARLKRCGPAGAEALYRLDAEQAGEDGTGTEA